MTPETLAAQARAELALLAYPDRAWVRPRSGCLDVLIIGGGQSGLATAHGLRREGVTNIAILDAAPAGKEGVWDNFARMPELRTPKLQNGIEFGQPSLSVQLWYEARHGAGSWDRITRIPRQDWMDYLRWYRATLDLPVENETLVTDIRPHSTGIIAVETSNGTRLARSVVWATGFEAGGAYRVPPVVTSALPPERFDHACKPIDLARLKGQRVGILGHGASAFDAAVAALDHGAASVDLCFRRPKLPTVNPHRHLETAGMMMHWPALSDAVRWNIARHMRIVDQPPGVASFHEAVSRPGFRMHAASPWNDVSFDDGDIRVVTPHCEFRFDHVICATGYALDLAARPELQHLVPAIALWRDRYVPDEPSAELAAFPYLDAGYEFLPRDPADDWVSRIHAFNFTSYVSMGPHSTSISGLKHALPRMVRALVRRLLAEQDDGVLAALRSYDEIDLVIPAGVASLTGS